MFRLPMIYVIEFALGVMLLASAASAVELVSINGSGTDSGNSFSRLSVISADGRLVIFPTFASDLGPMDTNGTADVYVRNRQTATTALVSVNGSGNDAGNSISRSPAISSDARVVAFISLASDLGPTDSNSVFDVYVRDLHTQITTLVSVNGAGTDSGNALSFSPAISANGRFVAFRSFASDLGPTDSNGTGDIYIRDLHTETTTLVSVNASGTNGGNSASSSPVISANGDLVAFQSLASDLGPTDSNGVEDIYVRDLRMATTTLASINGAGTDSGNFFSFSPTISAEGRLVAFESLASNLGPTDTNETFDVYVRDMQMGATILASIATTGSDSGNSASSSPVISANGRFVAFESGASDLDPIDTNAAQDIYVRDLGMGITTLASVNDTGNASGNSASSAPAISANGRFVVFQSNASDLGPTDTNGTTDIYARDLRTATTTLASVNAAGTNSANSLSFIPMISANGRLVVFDSFASDFGATDTNGTFDVYVSQISTPTIATIRDELQQLVDNNPDTELADEIEDAVASLSTALEELDKTPPDNQAAMGNIEGAVGDLEESVGDGLLGLDQGTDLMDQLAEIARQLAVTALEEAITGAGDASTIAAAQTLLDEADVLLASSAFKDAVAKYKDALAKADNA